jgi:PilZ domain
VKLWQREREAGDAGENVRTTPASELQLPEPPHPVKLAMPSGESMPARIAAREGEELVVLMLYTLGRPLRDAERHLIVIEVTDDEGTMRLGGTATIVDHETLRFSDLHLVQRREYVRVKAALPVEVSIGSDAGVGCNSVDLSGGGMLLRGVGMARAGEKLEFILTIEPDDPAIRGTATIIRCDSQGNCAICFEHISEGDRRRLIRFLFDRQREERRKGLRPESANGR